MTLADVVTELQAILAALQQLPDPAALQTQVTNLQQSVADLKTKIANAQAALA